VQRTKDLPPQSTQQASRKLRSQSFPVGDPTSTVF
jgi:hypothetical protein